MRQYCVSALILAVVSGLPASQSFADDASGRGAMLLQFIDPLALTPEETASFTDMQRSRVFEFATFNVAPLADASELVASQISGTARYSGAMLMRIDESDEFLSAQARITVSFNAGTMMGRVDNLAFTGPGADGRSETPALDTLTLLPTAFSGTTLQGTMQGQFDEGGFLSLSEPDDEHIVDATFDARFVDAAPGDASTHMVGTVAGSITSRDDGTRPLAGTLILKSGF